MARIEITMTSDYVSQWGVWEGIRELVQNARDGEIDENAPMSVRLTDRGKLILTNEGATLSRDALLIGHSSKANKQNTLGQFGEGLKLGTLALCRAGYTVTIYNGDEIWQAGIEQSERFGREVLVFHTRKSKAANPRNKLEVAVYPIDKETWAECRKMFLFLQNPQDMIETTRGKLILDEAYRGHIFVKGIFVDRAGSKYGYDMPRAQIDRDRRMLRSFELRFEASRIWEEVIKQDEARQAELTDRLYRMIEENTEEVRDFNIVNPGDQLTDILYQKWKENYGKDSYPVSSMAESKEISHAGGYGVVCSSPLREVIQRKTGEPAEIKERLQSTNKVMLSYQDLTEDEERILTRVANMIQNVLTSKDILSMINIVQYPGKPTVQGSFDSSTGMVALAREVLSDEVECLHTLAHEIAHAIGEDGSRSHTEGMGALLAKIAINNLSLSAHRSLSAQGVE